MRLKLRGECVHISELSVLYKPLNSELYINGIDDAAEFLKNIWYPGLINVQTLFYAIYLDVNQKVICWHLLDTGPETSSKCDKKIIALTAIRECASSVILAHNSINGKARPSA